MSGGLPKGWVLTPVSSICEQIRGVSYAKDDVLFEPREGHIPLLRANNINGEINFKDLQYVPMEIVSSKQFLQIGDVVLAMSSGSKKVVGKSAPIAVKWNGTFGAFCGVLRPATALNSSYFAFFFQTKEYRNKISELATGTNINNIRAVYFEMIAFPLAPLNEQKRIVAKLDAIMPRIDSVKERLEKIPAMLKRFRQSVLTAAVTGKLTGKWREEHPDVESADGLLNEKMRMDKQHYASYWNDFDIPQKWICALLKNIADLRLGKMLDSSKNKGVSMLYLRNINVRWFGFDLESLKEIRITQAEKEALSIQPGDVFVCEGGEPGRSAVWKASESNITFQKALHRVRMKIAFLPDLLVYNLKVDADKQKLDELFTGSTIKHFTGRSLAVYPVAIPPLDEQKEIVRQVDKLCALADKVEEHYQKARARVDALAQSVLAKAFRGELVPQNPGDEPAEKLLQRIQEEKAKMEAKMKTASRSKRATRKKGAKTQRAQREEKQASEP